MAHTAALGLLHAVLQVQPAVVAVPYRRAVTGCPHRAAVPLALIHPLPPVAVPAYQTIRRPAVLDPVQTQRLVHEVAQTAVRKRPLYYAGVPVRQSPAANHQMHRPAPPLNQYAGAPCLPDAEDPRGSGQEHPVYMETYTAGKHPAEEMLHPVQESRRQPAS